MHVVGIIVTVNKFMADAVSMPMFMIVKRDVEVTVEAIGDATERSNARRVLARLVSAPESARDSS